MKMEREAALRQVEQEKQRLELEEQNHRRILLQEETEREQQELEEELETKRQLTDYENPACRSQDSGAGRAAVGARQRLRLG